MQSAESPWFILSCLPVSNNNKNATNKQTKILTDKYIQQINKQNKNKQTSQVILRGLPVSDTFIRVSKYPLQYLGPMGLCSYYFTSYKRSTITPHTGHLQYLTYSLEISKYCLLRSIWGCLPMYHILPPIKDV